MFSIFLKAEQQKQALKTKLLEKMPKIGVLGEWINTLIFSETADKTELFEEP